MGQRVYRTARGKIIDLGELQMKNESVRAVGNMGVNARGDKIDPMGHVVDSKGDQVRREYEKQSSNVKSKPVATSNRTATISEPITHVVHAPESVNDDPEVMLQGLDSPSDIAPPKQQVGGLAAAIAARKTVSQDPMKTPRQESRDKDGVNKI